MSESKIQVSSTLIRNETHSYEREEKKSMTPFRHLKYIYIYPTRDILKEALKNETGLSFHMTIRRKTRFLLKSGIRKCHDIVRHICPQMYDVPYTILNLSL